MWLKMEFLFRFLAMQIVSSNLDYFTYWLGSWLLYFIGSSLGCESNSFELTVYKLLVLVLAIYLLDCFESWFYGLFSRILAPPIIGLSLRYIFSWFKFWLYFLFNRFLAVQTIGSSFAYIKPIGWWLIATYIYVLLVLTLVL